ncbi:protein kinase C and casein kinase substrate in neurons protein 1 isoform X1 [Salmo salar]|uniref:Protein kinase C and casein kinase substrate in neurons protein 1 isoform X1 n=2 Tax=Salmo TaxID=8028 RepID=A0A1S3MF85_SALSA|nr:protein kinase C and casein kinase substrate in neurons protein 1 isoform X1 [Salmo salar]XP_014001863.1 protein kinase C and casein kinase substrate in neurons protein 1 isoform X1 [Salmo salar]XP_029575065.1 protein kinase C and casein kinase substrate in neurons protein 1-like isoform X1 [Salmo trutta]XP_029575066.1 protein kinase C and casein kinase substrate in neurons protein 1-like isoform X1 [Salmo trutta]XP_029575067.1 protein kinase C and casein kinase substrate in neurons protein |eukprot:XP_014001861.1 PREDICTED: protein kinase C and casein kinase substrate in neurons protein 1 isoform X1 [Salmo salar]
MSGSYDESAAAADDAMDSFWEVGNYKRAVKRIDDGHRLCNDLMGCLQERAKIEKAYGDQLTAWSKRWRQLIEKGPQYGTVERAWLGVMTEAEKVSELHQEVKNGLLNEDLEKVKNWQKEAYHKQMIGGFKEAKEADEGFKKAQKPWAKKLKEMETAKKTYHMACKEEKLAATREADGKTQASVTTDQQKKLHEKTDKCKHDVQKAKEKYEKSLSELSAVTPPYQESMEQVFDQCQQHEVKRLTFLKEILLDIKRHLNLTENQSYSTVYRELERTILGANTQEDLQWFSNHHGPGMHMNWPMFEEYNPDATAAVVKREKVQKPAGAPPTPSTDHVAPPGDRGSISADHVAPPGDRGSVSSYEKNQAYSTEWSDDDAPAAYSGGETNGGGNGNSFEEDSGSAGKGGAGTGTASGVRVRALYDYDGQEQDELTFKAGDELTKTEDEDDQGWCRGRLDTGREGLYPANYVEEI